MILNVSTDRRILPDDEVANYRLKGTTVEVELLNRLC